MPDAEDELTTFDYVRPLMEAVGNVAHHFALLEQEINKAIWGLSAVSPEAGACVTAQIVPIASRMRALVSLVALNGGSKKSIDSLNRFTTQVDKLARKRNRVIHDPWVFRTRTIEKGVLEVQYGRHEISADRKLVYEIKVESHADVLKIAHEAIAARRRFIDLYGNIQAELKAQKGLPPGKDSGNFQDYPLPKSDD